MRSNEFILTNQIVKKATEKKFLLPLQNHAQKDAAHFNISLTGIAEKTSGTNKSPIGSVYIGWSRKKESGSLCHQFVGGRLTLEKKFAEIAFLTLLKK